MVTPNTMQSAARTLTEGAQEQRGPALTERELLRAVVEFANDKTAISGPLLLPALWTHRVDDPAPPGTDALHQQLRADFETAITEDVMPEAITKRLLAAASKMAAIPDFHVERTKDRRRQRVLRARWYYVPVTLEAVLSYAVLLLRDETFGLGRDLKQCQLPGCGKFFFSSDQSQEKGRPRTKYCSEEHMALGQTPGAERTRKWRAEKTKRAAQAAKHK